MNPAALDAAIPAGETIVLDSSAILAYLSGAEAASPASASIIDGFVASGRNRAVVSAITVTETLVRPLRAGAPTAVRIVEDFLLRFPNLRVDPVSFETARVAAEIRARTAAPAPDALILATAVTAGARIVVANDRSWPAIARRAGLSVKIVLLDR